MPELPEVQTVVTQLGRKIVGKIFSGFWSDWERKVSPSSTELECGIRGAAVLGTRRFGKHIVIDLDNRHSLVIHLKMTGHLLHKTEENRESRAFTEDRYNGYIHHIFSFADGSTLEFSDLRKFGWIMLVETIEGRQVWQGPGTMNEGVTVSIPADRVAAGDYLAVLFDTAGGRRTERNQYFFRVQRTSPR